MASPTCPDDATLEKMLLGMLSEADQNAVGSHLLICESCAMKANTTEVTDDVTEAIRNRRDLPGNDDAPASDVAYAEKDTEKVIEQVVTSQNTAQLEETQAGVSPMKKTEPVADLSSSNQLHEINFLAPPQSSDEIGRLGDYRVLQLLGVGGMGMVFRAEDPRLKRQIALKVMKPSIASSQSAKDRFIREAQFNAAIEHDNIVHIYQVGEDRGVPFIAMQYLRGESLKTLIDRERKLKQAEVVRIGKEVAAGLAAAHERGLIHRDVKPDNIWIEEKTHRAKILDFGLVRATAEDSGLTMSGMVIGTPQYMAPAFFTLFTKLTP